MQVLVDESEAHRRHDSIQPSSRKQVSKRRTSMGWRILHHHPSINFPLPLLARRLCFGLEETTPTIRVDRPFDKQASRRRNEIAADGAGVSTVRSFPVRDRLLGHLCGCFSHPRKQNRHGRGGSNSPAQYETAADLVGVIHCFFFLLRLSPHLDVQYYHEPQARG